MPDGLSITVEDENGYMGVRNWYENNPDSKEKPTLKYSMDGVDIIYQDGTTKTIYTETEMHKYYRSCSYKDDNKKSWVCFRLVYPITYIMSDGSNILMEDKKDWTELKGWHGNNPKSDGRPVLEYPVDIIYQDGTTQTIINIEEMKNAKENCRD